MMKVAVKLAGGDVPAVNAARGLLRPIKNGGVGLIPPRVIADIARSSALQRAFKHFGLVPDAEPTPHQGDGAQAKVVLQHLGVNSRGTGKIGVAFRTLVSWGCLPASNATIITHMRSILDLPASFDGLGETNSPPCAACGKPMAETIHCLTCWAKGGPVSGGAHFIRVHDAIVDELARSLRELAGEPVMQREIMHVLPAQHRPDGYVAAARTPGGGAAWFIDVTVVQGDVVAAENAKAQKYKGLGVGIPGDQTKCFLPIALNKRGDLGPNSAKAVALLASAAAYLGERKDRGVVAVTVAATIGRALWSNLARRLAAFCEAAGVTPAVPSPPIEPTAGWQKRRLAQRAEELFKEMMADVSPSTHFNNNSSNNNPVQVTAPAAHAAGAAST